MDLHAGHSHKKWMAVSSPQWHRSQSGSSLNPIRLLYLFKPMWPVITPIVILRFAFFKDSSFRVISTFTSLSNCFVLCATCVDFHASFVIYRAGNATVGVSISWPAPNFANWSALQFPSMPLFEGVHKSVTLLWLDRVFSSLMHSATSLDLVTLPVRALIACWLSVHIISGVPTSSLLAISLQHICIVANFACFTVKSVFSLGF